MIKNDCLEDVLTYTSEAEKQIKSMVGVSDFYYALKRFDNCTFVHSEDIAKLAVIIGLKKGIEGDRLVNLAISGYLHDV